LFCIFIAIFLGKAKPFMEEIDEHNRQVDEYEQELKIKMKKYIKLMSKKELEEAFLECLYQVAGFYNNFISDRVGY